MRFAAGVDCRAPPCPDGPAVGRPVGTFPSPARSSPALLRAEDFRAARFLRATSFRSSTIRFLCSSLSFVQSPLGIRLLRLMFLSSWLMLSGELCGTKVLLLPWLSDSETVDVPEVVERRVSLTLHSSPSESELIGLPASFGSALGGLFAVALTPEPALLTPPTRARDCRRLFEGEPLLNSPTRSFFDWASTDPALLSSLVLSIIGYVRRSVARFSVGTVIFRRIPRYQQYPTVLGRSWLAPLPRPCLKRCFSGPGSHRYTKPPHHDKVATPGGDGLHY